MASTTVETFLTDVRYDLKDHGKQKFDNTYLVKMMNRGINVLENELIAMKSDLTVAYATTTLSSSNNYVNLSSTVDSIRRLYIGQTELYQISMEALMMRRVEVIDTSTGQPYYFAIWAKPSSSNGRRVEFDYTADDDYTIKYIYDALTADFDVDDISTDYMPYDDMFNDFLREGIVILCQKTKDDNIVQVDRIWRELFRRNMQRLALTTSTFPKYRYIDF